LVREDVTACRAERKWIDARDYRDGQLAVEMGEERAAARWLPLQRVAERIRRDGDHDEIGPIAKWRAAVSATWSAVEK
jgi:hypothetical protein